MKNIINNLKFIVICALFISAWQTTSSAEQLEVCFFDTGHGNFTIVKKGYKALIIDCGASSNPNGLVTTKYQNLFAVSGSSMMALKGFLSGITQCETVISHNHRDHDNLYDVIKQTFAGLPPKRNSWTTNALDTLNLLKNALGPDVEIIPIRPDTWTTYVNEEHDKNLIVKVKFAGRSILFTGDASPQLITEMLNDPRYHNDLIDVDILVLPHHGSNQSGELLSFYAINPELCVVCGDPEEQYNLPWSTIAKLQFSPEKLAGVTTQLHNISVRKEPKPTNSPFSIKRNVLVPVFVTCNSTAAYYRLEILSSGQIQFFDGTTKNNSLFSSALTKEKVDKKLVYEERRQKILLQMMQQHSSINPSPSSSFSSSSATTTASIEDSY
jgi:beta-lactamase superfamily II metal-dependent hydrolase